MHLSRSAKIEPDEAALAEARQVRAARRTERAEPSGPRHEQSARMFDDLADGDLAAFAASVGIPVADLLNDPPQPSAASGGASTPSNRALPEVAAAMEAALFEGSDRG